jgi:hypothetical protein
MESHLTGLSSLTQSGSSNTGESLADYISHYKGASRYTRLLRLAECDDPRDAKVSIEAIKYCLTLAKSENQLG